MIKIRRSHDRLIFIMGIPTPRKNVFLLKQSPDHPANIDLSVLTFTLATDKHNDSTDDGRQREHDSSIHQAHSEDRQALEATAALLIHRLKTSRRVFVDGRKDPRNPRPSRIESLHPGYGLLRRCEDETCWLLLRARRHGTCEMIGDW